MLRINFILLIERRQAIVSHEPKDKSYHWVWDLFPTHKYLKDEFNILLAIDCLQHNFAIRNEIVLLDYFDKNIANIFNNEFTPLVPAFLLTGLKLGLDLIKKKFDDLQLYLSALWQLIGIASKIKIEVQHYSVDYGFVVSMINE